MVKIESWLSLSLLGMLFLLLNAAPAQAQYQTWVSGVGTDANSCIRPAPCRTFTYALSQTNAGGIINCLDPGDFSGAPLTITKSITIDCTGTYGGVLGGSPGITINALATDTVILRGLSIDGLGSAGIGVNVVSVGTLRIE